MRESLGTINNVGGSISLLCIYCLLLLFFVEMTQHSLTLKTDINKKVTAIKKMLNYFCWWIILIISSVLKYKLNLTCSCAETVKRLSDFLLRKHILSDSVLKQQSKLIVSCLFEDLIRTSFNTTTMRRQGKEGKRMKDATGRAKTFKREAHLNTITETRTAAVWFVKMCSEWQWAAMSLSLNKK